MSRPSAPAPGNDIDVQLAALVERFWTWRRLTQPSGHDDVPRVERPDDWSPTWSQDAVQAVRHDLRTQRQCLNALDLSQASRPEQVDARLLRCGLDRVAWELDVLCRWQRDPRFYFDQALVPIYELMLRPPPFDEARTAALLLRLESVPRLLEEGRTNIAESGVPEFAAATIELLAAGEVGLSYALLELMPLLPPAQRHPIQRAGAAATAAMVGYRTWLGGRTFHGEVAIGLGALNFYLHRVALLPYSSDDLRSWSRREEDRFAIAEAIHAAAKEPEHLVEAADFIDRQPELEVQVRAFYRSSGFLTLPDSVRTYRFAAMPDYLAPLAWIGQPHYLGSSQRPSEPAVRYISHSQSGAGYFELSKMRDPRTGIVHEGVHAHQLAHSWTHPRPARRHYYDSCVNEGVAFYTEESMLTAGLFSDRPRSAEFLANGGRLRNRRLAVDIDLALGKLSIKQGVVRLAALVDHRTALDEARSFATNPGLGLSYQAGKWQIAALLADYVSTPGRSLDAFNQNLWLNGNVPLALQRWELLDDPSDLNAARALAAAHC